MHVYQVTQCVRQTNQIKLQTGPNQFGQFWVLATNTSNIYNYRLLWHIVTICLFYFLRKLCWEQAKPVLVWFGLIPNREIACLRCNTQLGPTNERKFSHSFAI